MSNLQIFFGFLCDVGLRLDTRSLAIIWSAKFLLRSVSLDLDIATDSTVWILLCELQVQLT